ncbi:MAG: O-antigen ligase family protein [Smithellaceae bacterium]|nr:O-antigen ligase family protein [Smithellaceae bacterium]
MTDRTHLYREYLSVSFLILAFISSFFFNGKIFYFFVAAEIFLLLALVTTLFQVRERGLPIKVSPVSLLILLFLGYLFLSIFWSEVPYSSAITAARIAVLGLAFFACLISERKEALWRVFFAAACLVMALQSILASYQLFYLLKPPQGFFLYQNLFASLLNLTILILGATYLRGKKTFMRSGVWILLLLFFLELTVGLIQSRGALLSLALGGALFLIGGVYLNIDKRLLAHLVIGAILALALAHLLTLSSPKSLLSMVDPPLAGKERFIIWQGCWEMIKNQPLWGLGLGTFFLAWPPYRNPLDASGGFYAHNDFLQLWIEGGLPALAILLLIFFAISLTFFKAIRAVQLDQTRKTEILGLACGMFVVAFQSFFDFNLYSMPTMIFLGLALGRFDDLAGIDRREIIVNPYTLVRRGVYRLCLLLLALLAISYFASMGFSYYFSQRGVQQIAKKNYYQASEDLNLSHKIWRSYDQPLTYLAQLIQSFIAAENDKTLDIQARQSMSEIAGEYLDEAQRLNPFRARSYFVRGLLFEATKRGDGEIQGQYKKALEVDPGFFPARIEYARYLAQTERSRAALKVLDEGLLLQWYAHDPAVIPYYRFAAALRRQNGNLAGALELETKIAGILEAYKWEK